MKIHYFQQKGQREYQQDFYWHEEELGLFVLCDGMGGAASGDVASEIVVDTIITKAKNGLLPSNEENIQKLVALAEAALSNRLKTHPEEKGSGTTLTLLYLQPDKAILAHIGDSRIYHIQTNDNQIWHTEDHSFVQELFRSGLIKTEAEMRSHPQRNRLTKALRASNKPKPIQATISTIESIAKGDVFILCSDGILEPFNAEAFQKICLDKTLSLSEKVTQIKTRCAQESQDNNTAYFIEID